MHFIHQNSGILLIIMIALAVILAFPFCHWQEKRREAIDRDYYEGHWKQWHPRT